ncbi:ATP-binding protein [Lyngbya aestuarii]|uniref:ATP-binding protein n=1 Tax=Lyngbya aestuarii TaxID=118322 RepID=UPI00403D924A
MYIRASSEFFALCQSQVTVLTQGMGAALCVVYLTEELVKGGQTKLMPVVVYPEATAVWPEDHAELALPEQVDKIDKIPRLSKAIPLLLPQPSDDNQEEEEVKTLPNWQENLLSRQRQIVVPLIDEDVVLGLLVTSREDRSWNDQEKATIEKIARTLAIAYILDQRRAWFEQQLAQQELYQEKQRDLLHDLLHQFRNPMTAIKTFGKLLLKRLQPGDKNQEVAASIVRESDRLQELLQQFSASIDYNQQDIAPPALPAAITAKVYPLPTRENHQLTYPTCNSQQPTTIEELPILANKVISLESLSVTEVLEPLLISARVIAQEQDLELRSQIPSDLPPVIGNAKMLREALSNIIDNALKYTPAGGTINVRVGIGQKALQDKTITISSKSSTKEDDSTTQGQDLVIAKTSERYPDYLAILISDTGEGIPPQDLNHLFERHYRGVQASTEIPGSGLGLAIAKELVEQMHGAIEVFSPAKPKPIHQNSESATTNTQDKAREGTTFIVWLPARP